MSDRLDKMDINAIKAMDGEGMTQKEIGIAMGIDQSTVSRVLGGGTSDIDRIADRMEYFLGGATVDSGCYTTIAVEGDYDDRYEASHNRQECKYVYDDPTADMADMLKFFEKIEDKME